MVHQKEQKVWTFGNSLANTMDEANKQMDISVGKLKEIANLFKEGFKISFGDTNFDVVLKHLGSIKNNLIDIFTDKNVISSAQSFVDKFAYSLGQVVGAFGRIGKNAIELLVGSIDKYLSQNTDRIKNHLSNIFEISGKDIELTGNLWQALGEISDVFSGDMAKQIGSNIISMFANPFMSAMEFIGKFTTDLRAVFVQPIIDNTDEIKKALESAFKSIQTVTSTLSNAFTYLGDKLNEVYDNSIGPLLESIKNGLSNTFGKFLDVYNENIAPALQRMAEKFDELWNEHLKPLVDKIGEFVGSIADAIKALWENILKPVIDWIVENVLPVITPILEGLWNTVCKVFGGIADTIGGIIDFFKGIIDFFVGVFTGDWEKAWNGIKSIFTGIWDAIKGFFTTIWEALKGIVEAGINIIKSIIETIWNGICDFFKNIWNAIVNEVKRNIENMKNFISNALNGIKNIWNNIWNSITNAVSNVWKTITSKIKEGVLGAWNAITSIFRKHRQLV